MSETCFVTGGSGFIGLRLAERLVARGKRVKCLVRATSKRDALRRLGVEFVEGGLDDYESLLRGVDGCDRVFHLAGLTRELRSGEFHRVNCEGTRNVARACSEVGVERLTSVSSLAAAGIGVKEKGVEKKEGYSPYRLRVETDLPRPISPYGRSKRAGELALCEYAEKTSIVVIRPPYVFGEGDYLSLQLFKMVKTGGKIVIPGYIDYYYSFIHVDDLVDALCVVSERGERLTTTSFSALEDGKSCSGRGVYFSACPKPIRFSEFGTLIGRGYGREKVFAINVPPMGVLGTGVYGEIVKAFRHKHAALDWNKAVEAVRGPWICSGDKLTTDLDFTIEPALDEKIARVAQWYERQGLC